VKPKKIFIIRHGQSEGNVDKNIYNKKPDYCLKLTDLGVQQAIAAGVELSKHDGQFACYYSSFHRTRQTAANILNKLNESRTLDKKFIKEDPRLREQEWCGKIPKYGFEEGSKGDEIETERDAYGHFYYRFETGESCADVYDRVSTFLSTLHRDFEKEDFPENVLLVMHGMSMRVLIMRWFHMTVEEFEEIKNPKNCAIWQMDLQMDGKYKMITNWDKHVINHKNQYDIELNF